MTLVFIVVHPASKENYRIEQDGSEEMFWQAVGSMLREMMQKDKHYFEIAVFEAWSIGDYVKKLKESGIEDKLR